MANRLLVAIAVAAVLVPAVATARNHHVIDFAVSGSGAAAGLAYDSYAQHFLVTNPLSPFLTILSVSDAGVVETLISDPSVGAAASVAVDSSRRRVIAAGSRAVVAYDVSPPRPYRKVFASSLPDGAGDPKDVTVNTATGVAFVLAGNAIYKIGVNGEVALLVDSLADDNLPLTGIAARSGRAYLLATQPESGNIIKVDADDGIARAVTIKEGSLPAIVIQRDGTAVVAGGKHVRLLQSGDGWDEAKVQDSAAADGGEVMAVAARDGRKAYVLFAGGHKGYRIEEVKWKGEEGDMMWGFFLVVLGLCYFLFWKLQMGALVSSLNKKRE